MPDDLLVLRVSDAPTSLPAGTPPAERLTIRPVTPADAPALASLYLASYPPDVGAADLDAALAEIGATFSGDYGQLLGAASLLAHLDGSPAGAVLTTSRSIWDADLDSPFVIDFFVDPSARNRGVGGALMLRAIQACRAEHRSTVALRVGEGTSAAAHALYRRLGFRPRVVSSAPATRR